MSRSCFLDAAKRDQILRAVAGGTSLQRVASSAGCDPRTVRREFERNDEFRRQFKEAQRAADGTPLEAMQNAARSNWRAAAWLLERTQPEKFAKKNAHLLSHSEARSFVARIVALIDQQFPDAVERERIIGNFGQILPAPLGPLWAQQLTTRRERQAPSPANPRSYVDTVFDKLRAARKLYEESTPRPVPVAAPTLPAGAVLPAPPPALQPPAERRLDPAASNSPVIRNSLDVVPPRFQTAVSQPVSGNGQAKSG